MVIYNDTLLIKQLRPFLSATLMLVIALLISSAFRLLSVMLSVNLKRSIEIIIHVDCCYHSLGDGDGLNTIILE